jgi:hypothetical protein
VAQRRLAPSRRQQVRILILGSVLGAVASWLIWGSATSSAPAGPRIDGAKLAGHVWEAVDPSPSAPPTCRSLTESEIGPWRCSIRYAGGSAPDWAPLQRDKQFRARIETVSLAVARDGSFRGRTAEGRAVSGCCVRVR